MRQKDKKNRKPPTLLLRPGFRLNFYSYGYCSYFNSEKNITSS